MNSFLLRLHTHIYPRGATLSLLLPNRSLFPVAMCTVLYLRGLEKKYLAGHWPNGRKQRFWSHMCDPPTHARTSPTTKEGRKPQATLTELSKERSIDDFLLYAFQFRPWCEEDYSFRNAKRYLVRISCGVRKYLNANLMYVQEKKNLGIKYC